MKKNKIIVFVESFIILPIMATSVSVGNLPKTEVNIFSSSIIALSQSNIVSNINSTNSIEDKILEMQAEAIDAYFSAREMPLMGLGLKMAIEAKKNELDWRLLPAIAVRESTGGKFDCKKVDFNPFGWGSCKIGFKSNEEAIEIVAKNLGGNNPNTARYYDNKTVAQILRAYNPPSIVLHYVKQVMSIMNIIGDEEVYSK